MRSPQEYDVYHKASEISGLESIPELTKPPHHLIAVYAETFQPDRIGRIFFDHVPDIKGKNRQAGIFQIPVRDLGIFPRQAAQLEHAGIRTFAQFLNTPTERPELSPLVDDSDFVMSVYRYLDFHTITGEARLWEAVFDTHQYPIPKDREDELRKGIHDLLFTLPPFERRVLQMHYGLLNTNGIPKTQEEIARYFSQEPEYVQELTAAAMDRLQHPSRRKRIQHLATTAPESFGRDLGFVFLKDSPNSNLSRVTPLSKAAERALIDRNLSLRAFDTLLRADLTEHDELPDTVYAEIQNAIVQALKLPEDY